MSTILDGAREGRLSMCVLLSVWSSRRQQGAPFQFTHQPQRWGVKARGITAGDFTFEGRDYQSGEPCVEVMREEDRGGAVWGESGLSGGGVGGGGGDSGAVRGGGGGREQHDSTPPWNPWTLCFLGSLAAKLHICLTPGTVVWQSGAVCPDSHLSAL